MENINEITSLVKELELNLTPYKNDNLCKSCEEPKLQHCCNVMVEHKTYLKPAVYRGSKINSELKIDVKIEKVCAGAVIISGVIHKILSYKALLGNGTINSCYKKYIDVPFNCFISICGASEDDEYEITGHDFLCTYVITTDKDNGYKKHKKSYNTHTEKTLIKICVIRK